MGHVWFGKANIVHVLEEPVVVIEVVPQHVAEHGSVQFNVSKRDELAPCAVAPDAALVEEPGAALEVSPRSHASYALSRMPMYRPAASKMDKMHAPDEGLGLKV